MWGKGEGGGDKSRREGWDKSQGMSETMRGGGEGREEKHKERRRNESRGYISATNQSF